MRLEEKIAQILIKNKLTLSTAESCTGGLLAHRLTNVPGSSNFFKLGLITYSNEAKAKSLKIPLVTLKKYGAVSYQTATAMAKNVRKAQKTDFGIGISGIAGPTGGTKAKPIGLVYICVATQKESLCIECRFTGTRASIKQQSSTEALNLLNQFIE